MTTLTITMEHDVGAKALVRAALDNEVRLLETAIRRTKSRIRSFEERFKTGTADFLARYEAGDVQETLEADEIQSLIDSVPNVAREDAQAQAD